MGLFLREKPLLSTKDEERFLKRMDETEERRNENILHIKNVLSTNIWEDNPSFETVKQISEVAEKREQITELSRG